MDQNIEEPKKEHHKVKKFFKLAVVAAVAYDGVRKLYGAVKRNKIAK